MCHFYSLRGPSPLSIPGQGRTDAASAAADEDDAMDEPAKAERRHGRSRHSVTASRRAPSCKRLNILHGRQPPRAHAPNLLPPSRSRLVHVHGFCSLWHACSWPPRRHCSIFAKASSIKSKKGNSEILRSSSRCHSNNILG